MALYTKKWECPSCGQDISQDIDGIPLEDLQMPACQNCIENGEAESDEVPCPECGDLTDSLKIEQNGCCFQCFLDDIDDDYEEDYI